MHTVVTVICVVNYYCIFPVELWRLRVFTFWWVNGVLNHNWVDLKDMIFFLNWWDISEVATYLGSLFFFFFLMWSFSSSPFVVLPVLYSDFCEFFPQKGKLSLAFLFPVLIWRTQPKLAFDTRYQYPKYITLLCHIFERVG